MNKAALLEQIVTKLKAELEKMVEAQKDTTDRALEGEGRMKSRYDTKRIESSYLADGLNVRINDLLQEVSLATELRGRYSAPTTKVQGGSYVRVRTNGAEVAYFIVPFAAGQEFTIDDKVVSIITPRSPLAKALMNRAPGDELQANNQQYKVLEVA